MQSLSRTTLAGAVAALAIAPAAHAQAPTTAQVGGGQTMLQVDRATAQALNGAGVKVDLLGAATNGRSGLTFPVTGGRVDPATLRGTVNHSGGLRFRAGSTRVALTGLAYAIGARRATLSARVGGTRLPILSLDLRRARVAGGGPLVTRASGIRAALTAAAAKALNRAFGTTLFRGGLRLGTVRTEVAASEAVFRGGATTLALDAGAADALRSLDITPGLVGTARSTPQGFAFPITGGRVDAESLAGSITHGGGISLTRGSTRVELTEFTIGIDGSPTLSALVGGSRVEILSLDVSNITRGAQGRTITVGGVTARLTAAAAGALNQAFATEAFKEGLVLGTATVAGRLR